MGVELQPVFNPRSRELVYQAEGKALIDRLRALDSIAKEKGMASLTSFMDNREADMEADDFDFEEFAAAWNEWFSPRDGLLAVQGLLDVINADVQVRKRLKDLETVLSDLEELARCLDLAAQKGAQFRLQVH